jgi:hypothetical protein
LSGVDGGSGTLSTEKRNGTPPDPTLAPKPGSGETRRRTLTVEEPRVIFAVVRERWSVGSRIVSAKVAEPAPKERSLTVIVCGPATAFDPAERVKTAVATVVRGALTYLGTAGTDVTPVPKPEIERDPVPLASGGSPLRVTVMEVVVWVGKTLADPGESTTAASDWRASAAIETMAAATKRRRASPA